MPKRSQLLPLLLVALFALAPAAPADASHGEAVYFEASTALLNPSTRAKAFEQMRHLGVRALRVELYWGRVAPGGTSATRPSFDARDPASYDWSLYDPILSEAKHLGWQVLLTVTSPVPRWATSNLKAPYVTRPDSQDFREFMTAVARHFGSEVGTYAIWSEPNHPAFLQPQFNSNGTPASPRIYRGLYQAGYRGLQEAGLTHPRVLFGETAPTGYDSVKSLLRSEKSKALLHDVAPLAFLRESLCLNSRYRKVGSCSELPMTGYAHHAYTVAVPPTYKTPGADNVTVGVLSRLSGALNKAAHVHALPAGLPIYLTEFGVQSFPNKQLGVPVSVQAEYDAMAERIAYNNGRVAAFSQYLLEDDPVGGTPGASVNGGTVGFQTGLEYANGKPKPLYYAWPVPLAVSKRHHGYSLWGLVRPAGKATTVTVLVRKKGSSGYRTLRTVHTNAAGYWTLSSSTAGVLWRVRWVSPEGVRYEGPPIHAH
ncbi:MAG TPA: hypothetical protein VLZ06_07685 [Solirubrobacteraceae bacterium]|nr:hypothetical protein [Solirubrobacteraceae bacterium]